MNDGLVLDINTKSGSNYKVYRCKNGSNDFYNVLVSDSLAFKGADFVLLNKFEVKDRLNFMGTVYSNAKITINGDSLFDINVKDESDDIHTIDMSDLQYTTPVVSLKVINDELLDELVKIENFSV